MKIPNSELRIQICKCIVDFYHAEPPKKHITGEVFSSLLVTTYVYKTLFCLFEPTKTWWD